MTEKTVIPCSECGSNLSIPAAAAGRKVRCPKCKTVVAIPGGTATFRHEGRKTAFTSEPESRRARRFVNSASPVLRGRNSPETPAEDIWLDDEVASRGESGSEWDSYGPPEQSPQALPPRAKRRNIGSRAPAHRGTSHERPTPGEHPPGVMAKASNGSVITGILMMVGALIWFFGGLAAGIIFFYPPILFILGFVALVKGILRTE